MYMQYINIHALCILDIRGCGGGREREMEKERAEFENSPKTDTLDYV
jgi:hypothetical protein